MTTQTTSSSPLNVQPAPSSSRVATAHAGLPREVWPLLGTIGTTELVAAAVILWFSAPTVGPVAITGLGVGAAGVGALALGLRVFGKLTAPRPAPQTGHRSA